MSFTRLELVALKEIDTDRELVYRDDLAESPAAEALRSSVRRCGVLQPVRLQQGPAGLRVVAGFRRLQLARELGCNPVPAWIAGPDEDKFDLFCRAVEEHAAQPINVRERLRALSVAERLGISGSRVVGELLPALGLAAEARLLEDLRRLQPLSGSLVDLLARKSFSLRRCLPFTRLDHEEGEVLAAVARRLSLGGRQIEELFTSLLEIAAREGVSVLRVCDELGVSGAARAATLSPDLLSRVWTRRYPEASRRTRSLERAQQGLHGAAGAELRWDSALADEALELSFKLRSAAELDEFLRALGSERAREALRAAFREL